MIAKDNPLPGDQWSDWLLRRRHGGDPDLAKSVQQRIRSIRDRVLDGAKIAAGMTLVDVGAGDGLIAFGAFERIGRSLKTILTDVSRPLLQRAEQTAIQLGLGDRCEFLQTAAEKLEGIADATVDVVTTRAVLAYIADKPAAFRQFHRVLKPGGRLSIGEPIYQDDAMQLASLTNYLAANPSDSGAAQARLQQRWKAAQLPSTPQGILENPLTNFNERDLITLCQHAGFGEVHMELHIDVRKSATTSWNTFIDTAPRPNTPTLREILASSFVADEQRLLEDGLRPIVESGKMFERDAIAYLTAVKPH